jgi:tetratricopeptide (TPR) repeat protein
MPIRRLMSSALFFATLAASAAEAPSNTVDGPSASVAAEAPSDAVGAEPSASVGVAPGVDALPAPAMADIDAQIETAKHQIQTAEYQDAETQLKASIAEIEHRTWRYDRALAQPLVLLGDALSAQGKFSEALPAYEQARHVIRVNDGLHTPAQIETVYRESATLAAMGEMVKANAREEYAFETLVRAYDRYDEALVPGIMHLAQWYEKTLNVFAARNLYDYAVVIETRAHGDNSPTLIAPLEGQARTYREERYPSYHSAEGEDPFGPAAPGGYPTFTNQTITVNRFADGEKALAQVVRITASDPNASPLDLAVAELNLADWHLLFDHDQYATRLYVHARQVMRTKAGLTDDQIAAYFKPPQAIWLPIAEPMAPAVRSNPTEGYVEVSYTLTQRGECTDLKTVDSKPAGMMDTKVRRGLLVARFRPQFDGDTPVAAPNMIYRHTFTYYPHEKAPLHKQAAGHDSDAEEDDGKSDNGT